MSKHEEDKPGIVFLWVGEKYPSWFCRLLEYTKKNSRLNIDVIISKCNPLSSKKRIRDHANIVYIEDFYSGREYNRVCGAIDSKSLNGFWSHVIERFFILNEYLEHTDKKKVFFVELDNITYGLDRVFRGLDSHGSGIFYGREDRYHAGPGVIYINDRSELKELCSYIEVRLEDLQQASSREFCSDMTLLSEYMNMDTSRTFQLPTVLGLIGSNEGNEIELWDEGKRVVFDITSVGQYLLGADSRYIKNRRNRFLGEKHNEEDWSKLRFSVKTNCELEVRSATGESVRLANLHLHSKLTKKATSVRYMKYLTSCLNRGRAITTSTLKDKIMLHGLQEAKMLAKKGIGYRVNYLLRLLNRLGRIFSALGWYAVLCAEERCMVFILPARAEIYGHLLYLYFSIALVGTLPKGWKIRSRIVCSDDCCSFGTLDALGRYVKVVQGSRDKARYIYMIQKACLERLSPRMATFMVDSEMPVGLTFEKTQDKGLREVAAKRLLDCEKERAGMVDRSEIRDYGEIKDRPIACLQVRDCQYDVSYRESELVICHKYRNHDINEFVGAAEYLVSSGYSVVRTGIKGKPLRVSSDSQSNVLDLCKEDTIKGRLLTTDALLKADICLSTGSGPDLMAACNAQYCLLGLYSFNSLRESIPAKNIIVLPSRYIDKDTGNRVSTLDFLKRGSAGGLTSNDFDRLRIEPLRPVLDPLGLAQLLISIRMHEGIAEEFSDLFKESEEVRKFLVSERIYSKREASGVYVVDSWADFKT